MSSKNLQESLPTVRGVLLKEDHPGINWISRGIRWINGLHPWSSPHLIYRKLRKLRKPALGNWENWENLENWENINWEKFSFLSFLSFFIFSVFSVSSVFSVFSVGFLSYLSFLYLMGGDGHRSWISMIRITPRSSESLPGWGRQCQVRNNNDMPINAYWSIFWIICFESKFLRSLCTVWISFHVQASD